MRYRLRTLLIVLAVGPIFLAVSYWGVQEWQRRQAEAAAKAKAVAVHYLTWMESIDGFTPEGIEQSRRIHPEARADPHVMLSSDPAPP